MEPQIRFFTSFDGTRIAYAELGSGPPMVVPLLWNVWIEVQGAFGFQTPELFARRQHVIMFDPRGAGASRAEPASITLDAVVRDLAALADCLRLDRFDLCGIMTPGAPVAIAYAAAHPERVRRLVLEAPAGSAAEKGSLEGVAAMAEFIRGNWRGAARTVAGLALPSSTREDQRAYASLLYRAVPAEVAARYVEFDRQFDVRDLLPRIECPAMVLQYADRHFVPPEATRAVAAGIPDARLLTMNYLEYPQQLFEFLGHPLPAGDAALNASQLPSGMAVILFTDIVDSTARTERLGDRVFRTAARTLDEGTRAAIRDAGGTAIDGKLLGDGVLATFPSAAQAIDAAQRCHALSGASELPLHLGIHAGDVIREEHNVYGGAVNIASRICALSTPGEILVSDVVRGMARSSAGVTFEDRGEQEMKGVGEPVRVYAVRKDGA
jgi:class 3 adenylate cyclase